MSDVCCKRGKRGYSAYEIAVLDGFVGTEQDWLDELAASGANFANANLTFDNSRIHDLATLDLTLDNAGSIVFENEATKTVTFKGSPAAQSYFTVNDNGFKHSIWAANDETAGIAVRGIATGSNGIGAVFTGDARGVESVRSSGAAFYCLGGVGKEGLRVNQIGSGIGVVMNLVSATGKGLHIDGVADNLSRGVFVDGITDSARGIESWADDATAYALYTRGKIIFHDFTGSDPKFTMDEDGLFSIDVPTGRAAVAVGQMFVDTAANILANNDLIYAIKV